MELPILTVENRSRSVREWKIPEGAVNVPSFESADPEFNSTLLNGTIVFSILKFVSMLATNAERIGQTGSSEGQHGSSAAGYKYR